MNTILSINNSLDSLGENLFKNPYAFEAINLLKKRMYTLSKTEESLLLENYDKNTFPKILEYITHTLNFYNKNKVYLPLNFKQELILKYINDFEQIASSVEDLFECAFTGLKLNETAIWHV